MASPWISRLLSRSRGRPSEAPPQVAASVAPEPAAAAEPVELDPGDVGVDDVKLCGWLNEDAGELAPGFAIFADDVVVDVGAGDGGLAGFCARRARQTVLIDHDEARLEYALGRLRDFGIHRVSGQPGDASKTSLPDAFATRVICTEVLEHVDDPAEVMAELVRIGQPGALYMLSVPGTVSERLQTHVAPQHYFEKPNHIRIFEEDELARLAEAAGLVVEHRCVQGFYWTMWWMFFWQCGIDFGAGSHPLLDSWNRTWTELLKTPDAARVKLALDRLAPKVNAVVARKPA